MPRSLLATLLTILAPWLLATCAAPVPTARPPNVVVIVADDLGAMDLGCCGSTFHRTPNLDRMAAEGVRFTNSYAACPVCSPSRAALLTGRWPQRFGLTDWIPGRGDGVGQRLQVPKVADHLPLEETTLAEILSAAGYTCAQIGKWHLGGAGSEPARHGFAVNVAGDAAGHPASYFAPFLGRDGKPLPGLADAKPGEYLTDRLTTEAERFLQAQQGRPFFLWLSHFAPHMPLQAKPELVAKYPAATPFKGTQANPIYAAMLESIDESVGRVLAKLEELGIADDTIVVFTSDNGGLATLEGPNTPATSNAPLREGKGWLYEGGLRVPLLVRWARGASARGTCAVPVVGLDLVPTLCEACGVPMPTRCDGTSLLPLLRGNTELARDALYWHYPHYANQGSRPGGAVRVGAWKLVESYEEGRRELYDLAHDASEGTNLAEREPARVRDLAARLERWRGELGVPPLLPNPAFAPCAQRPTGEIVMPARAADVRGVQLRYEPLPHKNTLGYWVRQEDWARFEFTVTRAGSFAVEALVGCGKGCGGSTVHFEFFAPGAQGAVRTLELVVPETGGFQSFVPQKLGAVTLETTGRHELRVRAMTKPGPAVMDLREVRLVPR